MHRYIEPEVAGELGNKTIIETQYFPPKVRELHFIFNGWLGDDIIECFPCFIVSEKLMNSILTNELTGVFFEEMRISKSEEFIEMYPAREIPKFYWAKITGKFGIDDFVIANDFRLVISEKAYGVLQLANVKNAIFEQYSNIDSSNDKY